MAIAFHSGGGCPRETTGDDAVPLAALAERAHLTLDQRCGGKGICGGCRLRLGPGTYLVEGKRVELTDQDWLDAPACQTRVLSPSAVVTVPATSLAESKAQIDEAFRVPDYVAGETIRTLFLEIPGASLEAARSDRERLESALADSLQPGDGVEIPYSFVRDLPALLTVNASSVTATVGRITQGWRLIDLVQGRGELLHYGAAVDIGTTTVVAMLIDLESGEVVERASMYNQQISRGDDVASRISYATTAQAVTEMQSLVVKDTINPLLRTLCRTAGIQTDKVIRIAVSGNTLMAHLFLGLNPLGIATLPFTPVETVHPTMPAGELGLCIHPHAPVDVVPSIAGYLGGDIVSDIHVADLATDAGPSLLVDIGTNCEAVLCEGGLLTACAVAAGSAFEGAGILQGCRAAAGAVEHIRFGPDLDMELDVIGNVRPRGLCGTAVIDFMAHGMRIGLLNRMGRYDVEALRRAGRYQSLKVGDAAFHACAIADEHEAAGGQALVITEMDISRILNAKAATFAAMQTLMDSRGCRFEELRRVVLAGGSAHHLDIGNAMAIGLLPPIARERFETIGNGSLAGAFLALVEDNGIPRYEALAREPQVLELSQVKAFQDYYIDAMALPVETAARQHA